MTTLVVVATVTNSAGSAQASATIDVASVQVPVKFGETGIIGADDSNNPNFLIAQKVSVTSPGVLQSLSFYVITAAGNLRLGLYRADGAGGNPGTLVVETGSFVPVAGWNTKLVSAPITAGDYWLAYTPSSSGLHFRLLTGGSLRHVSRAFQAMPATFPANPLTAWDGTHFSFYMTVLVEQATIPPATGQITTFVGTAANWQSPSIIDGKAWYNHHGGRAWSLTKVDNFTLRMEIRQGDPGAIDVGGERSEFAGPEFADGDAATLEWDFVFEPGASLTSPQPAWFVINQWHDGDSIPAAIWLDGEIMKFSVNTYVAGTWPEVSDTAPLVRGQTYHFKCEIKHGVNGYVRYYRDGVLKLSHTGQVGTIGNGWYPKLGTYRGWDGLVPQTTAVRISNIRLS